MERLSALVEQLSRNQTAGDGRQEGMTDASKIIIAGVSLFATLLVIGGVLVTLVLFLNRSQAAPIYVPAPASTMLPSSPPSQVPR
jgi:hypothetical protein